MVFSTLLFLFRFLPVALLLYYLAPGKAKNTVLFVVSLIFYSWGEIRYFPIMILSTAVDFFLSRGIEKWRANRTICRVLLGTSVVFNLGMLVFFKYTDFFLGNFGALTGTSVPLLGLTLPLGISFYTFQTMSYTIDVYRDNVKAENNIIDFGAYVTMFPQLIAGPIVRYSDVAARLKITKGRVTPERIEEGVTQFIIGLGKKVLIANNVGALWTEVSAMSGISTPLAWLGIIAFGLQIYFDFSGYSQMAIGLGKLLGFDFPPNFNLPYISKSITEFWRRWHITLGSWFREYVYIPLGGNRKGPVRLVVNMFAVWALTGFWHGADWNFLIWGIYFFALLVAEKFWLLKFLERKPWLSHIYALLAITVGWTIFAISDLGALGTYLSTMFIPTAGISVVYYLRNYAVSILIAIFLSTPLPNMLYEKIKKIALLRVALLAAIFVASVAYLSNATYNPFLYFRF